MQKQKLQKRVCVVTFLVLESAGQSALAWGKW